MIASGTMLVPGVSRNRRWYKPDVIAAAVKRAQERIAAPDGLPLTMLTHHAAGDDSTCIVGHLTSVGINGKTGAAWYEAELADTDEARKIVDLVDGKHLRNVSIRGWWNGDVRQEQTPDGQLAETGDDLELDGLDFTKSPGVLGAEVRIDAAGAQESAGRRLIRESVDDSTLTEATVAHVLVDGLCSCAAEADTAVAYADPGYQADKRKRYPLDTKVHAKAAWSYINQAGNAKKYSSAQLKRIKGRIKAALKKFGVTVTAETSADVPATVAEQLGESTYTSVAECYDGDRAGFSVSANNGPLYVSVSCYAGIDSADLAIVAQKAMAAACAALAACDPDTDGGMAETGDDAMETVPDRPEPAPLSQRYAARHARPGVAEDHPTITAVVEEQEEVAPVADTQTAETTAARTLTDADLAALGGVLGETLKTALAPASPAAEAAPAAEASKPTATAAETTPEDIAKVVAEKVDEQIGKLRESLLQGGLRPARKGLVPQLDESTSDVPLHKLSDEAFRERRNAALNAFVP